MNLEIRRQKLASVLRCAFEDQTGVCGKTRAIMKARGKDPMLVIYHVNYQRHPEEEEEGEKKEKKKPGEENNGGSGRGRTPI